MTDVDLKTKDTLTKCLSPKIPFGNLFAFKMNGKHGISKRTTGYVELFHSPICLFLPLSCFSCHSAL